MRLESIKYGRINKYNLERDFACKIIGEDCVSIDRAANDVILKTKEIISTKASSLRPDDRLLFLDQLKDHFQNALENNEDFFIVNILGFYSYLLHRHVFKIEENNRPVSFLKGLLPKVIKLIEEGELRLFNTGSAAFYDPHLFFTNCRIIQSAAIRETSHKMFLRIVKDKVTAEDYFSELFPILPFRKHDNVPSIDNRVKFLLYVRDRSSIGENTLRLFEETKKTEFSELEINWQRILTSVIEYIDNLLGKRTPKLEFDDTSCSYRWLKNNITPSDLYHKLKRDGLISAETKEEDFVAAFSHLPLSKIKNKIQWEKSPSLFAYFFDNLAKERFIPNNPKWVIIEHHFTYFSSRKGKFIPVPESCKVYISQQQKYGLPKEADIVDNIFKELKA